MRLFRKPCSHSYKITERSNALQLDDMGYPLRLCICKCSKCGESTQQWLDTNKSALEELDSGKSVLVKWENAR